MAIGEGQSRERVVRVSFGWLLLGIVCVLALGWLGGVTALQWRGEPPLPDATQRLVTTVQEVTISPNVAAVELLQNKQRSVVLLARRHGDRLVATAAGTVVTNDGLVATVVSATDGLLAFDDQGRELAMRVIGRDELFGVTYLRLSESVLPPFDLRGEGVREAYELMGISRSENTFRPRIFFFPVQEAALPPELAPRGVQRVLRGPVLNDGQLAGSPLIDDEGKLAGVLLNPAAGLVLPADHVAASIERVSSGKREADPFEELGLRVRYTFEPPTEGGAELRLAALVTAVAPHSPAASGQVSVGDVITALSGVKLHWDELVSRQLADTRPLLLEIRRGDATVTLTVPL